MAKVFIKVDGKRIEAEEGELLIDALEKVGIHIPRLCYMRGLPNVASCRLCLCEVEGKGLLPACRVKVKEGIEVLTNTEEVRESRRFVLELLLSTHPLNCISCDKEGACLLQRYAYEHGVFGKFERLLPHYEIVSDEPFIEHDQNLCILCGRCIRACKRWGESVLDFMERGMATKVSTPASLSLKEAGCSFCGTCIQVCPTGARIEWGRRGCGKEWELSKKETLCPYCNLGCKIRVFTKDERTVRVDAIDAFICAKARFGFDAFSSDRLSTPLARRDGKLEEVEDEEALEFLAKEILRIKEEGEGLISFIGNGSFSIEDNYVLEKIARDVIGTENFASIHSSSSLQANYLPKVDDLWHCDLIFLIGEDVRWIAPVLFKKMEEVAKRGKKIFLINQRKIPKTPFLHIFCRSGVEHYLLLGLLKMLSEEALFKDKNMEQLKEIKMEEILEITGSKIDELKECIEAIRGAERVAFLYTPYFSLQDHAEGILESLLLPPSITIFPILPEPNILNRSLKRREEIIEMIKDARAIIALGDIPKALKDVMREDAFFCLFTTHLTEEMKERADFLFPSPAPHEVDGTFLNLVGKIRIKGIHDQIPLWQYLCKLSSLLGYSIKYEDVTEAIEKIKEERRGEAFERIVLKRFSPSSEYPFTLIAEGALSPLQEVWIKNSRVQKIYDLLYLSPKDAEKMQIKDEDEVFLSSKRGRIKAKVKIDEDIEEGVLKLPYFLASPLFEFHTCIEQVKLEKA